MASRDPPSKVHSCLAQMSRILLNIQDVPLGKSQSVGPLRRNETQEALGISVLTIPIKTGLKRYRILVLHHRAVQVTRDPVQVSSGQKPYPLSSLLMLGSTGPEHENECSGSSLCSAAERHVSVLYVNVLWLLLPFY